jgi:hypothetical protein
VSSFQSLQRTETQVFIALFQKVNPLFNKHKSICLKIKVWIYLLFVHFKTVTPISTKSGKMAENFLAELLDFSHLQFFNWSTWNKNFGTPPTAHEQFILAYWVLLYSTQLKTTKKYLAYIPLHYSFKTLNL